MVCLSIFKIFSFFSRRTVDPPTEGTEDGSVSDAPDLIYIERRLGPALRFLVYLVYVVIVVVVALLYSIYFDLGVARSMGLPLLAAFILFPWVAWLIYIDWRCPRCGELLAMIRKPRSPEPPNPLLHDAVDGPREVIAGLQKTGFDFLFDQYYREYERRRENLDSGEDHYQYDVHVATCEHCSFSVVRFRTKLNPWVKP